MGQIVPLEGLFVGQIVPPPSAGAVISRILPSKMLFQIELEKSSKKVKKTIVLNCQNLHKTTQDCFKIGFKKKIDLFVVFVTKKCMLSNVETLKISGLPR